MVGINKVKFIKDELKIILIILAIAKKTYQFGNIVKIFIQMPQVILKRL